MATIVLRNTKGSALTFTEGDDNFTNLNNDKLEDITNESISDLSDVTITTPSVGELLSYGAAGWENQTLAIPSNLNDLGDIDTSLAATDGQILVFNNSSGFFEAQDPASSGITDVVDDTTPELGGQLSANGNDIDMGGNQVKDADFIDYKESINAIGSNDSPTITVSDGNVQSVTITSGLALPAFSDAATGQSVTLIVSGSGTATGTANHKFAGGNTTLTTLSVVSIFYDGTNYLVSIATDFQ